jgi:hypothetical protein
MDGGAAAQRFACAATDARDPRRGLPRPWRWLVRRPWPPGVSLPAAGRGPRRGGSAGTCNLTNRQGDAQPHRLFLFSFTGTDSYRCGCGRAELATKNRATGDGLLPWYVRVSPPSASDFGAAAGALLLHCTSHPCSCGTGGAAIDPGPAGPRGPVGRRRGADVPARLHGSAGAVLHAVRSSHATAVLRRLAHGSIERRSSVRTVRSTVQAPVRRHRPQP